MALRLTILVSTFSKSGGIDREVKQQAKTSLKIRRKPYCFIGRRNRISDESMSSR